MKPKLLIIEDNEISMDLMILLLNGLGLAVIPALNGPAGLAIAKSEVPDLIISDIQMLHLDGHAVLKALREDRHLAHIPVVAVTAMTMVGDGERLLDAGFDGYLDKPVNYEELKMILVRHLPAWKGRIFTYEPL